MSIDNFFYLFYTDNRKYELKFYVYRKIYRKIGCDEKFGTIMQKEKLPMG